MISIIIKMIILSKYNNDKDYNKKVYNFIIRDRPILTLLAFRFNQLILLQMNPKKKMLQIREQK